MEYSSSFTAGGLLLNEFESLLPSLTEEGPGLFDSNLLQIASESARKRVTTEINKRLLMAEVGFWQFYRDADLSDRRLLLFYLCLKTYRLVQEFHFEVSLKNARRLQWNINLYDYQLYMASLANNNTVVGSWSENTQLKTITNYLRMVREAGLADKATLHRGKPSNALVTHLHETGTEWFLDACFLSQTEKNSYL